MQWAIFLLLLCVAGGPVLAVDEGALFIGGYTTCWHSRVLTLLAGGGPEEGRVNGTIAQKSSSDVFWKLGFDYLAQKNSYCFLSPAPFWSWQLSGAVSALMPVDVLWADYAEFGGYYSFASSHSFAPCSYADVMCSSYKIGRFTGAHAAGCQLGLLWVYSNCGTIKSCLNYDVVDYDGQLLHLGTRDGFGISVKWHQLLGNILHISMDVTTRSAYCHLYGGLHWELDDDDEKWLVGFFTAYATNGCDYPGRVMVGLEVKRCLDDSSATSRWASEPAHYPFRLRALPEAVVYHLSKPRDH